MNGQVAKIHMCNCLFSTRIPRLVPEQDFGGVGMRFISHMHMQWSIYVKREDNNW